MEINPQRVRSAEFKTVRKGVDPEEVRVFLADVADELERAQNQSTAMEARARAAVARLQELNESGATAAPAASLDAEEAETISRTLLLAQRTADSTVAEARAEAARVIADAKDEAAKTLDSTRAMSARLIDEAREEARRIGEVERGNVAGEVEALKARREFLESDVHHLEVFLVDQRARVREAASALLDIVERVPGGIGEVRAPLLSASDDGVGEREASEASGDGGDLLIVPDIAGDDDSAGVVDEAPIGESDEPVSVDEPVSTEQLEAADESEAADDSDGAASASLNDEPWADELGTAGEETMAMPMFGVDDERS